MFVLLDGLNPQTIPGQHCLVAWSIAWRWKELEIPMTPSEKKSQPWSGESDMSLSTWIVNYQQKHFGKLHHVRDACRETGNREEEAVQVEVLKHSLNGMTVNSKGNTGDVQVQAAADHVLCRQCVLIGRGDVARNPSCQHKQKLMVFVSCYYGT